MLSSVLATAETDITMQQFLICTIASLAMGLIAALICMYKNHYTQSFIISIVMLPALVQMVIMMVNGNVGAGVAVMGAFTLVRFRSTPGSAREISSIFMVMAIGLATGMGYIGVAFVFLVLLGIVNLLLAKFDFGKSKKDEKVLRVLLPESLSFGEALDDVLEQYTSSHVLRKVKTKNMGSMYQLTYDIVLKAPNSEKELIDALRTRNGNLSISLAAKLNSEEAL